MATSKYQCPTCHKLYDYGVFVCPDCEAIVNHTLIETALQPPKEPTVIRRLLSPTDAELEKPEPTFPGQEPAPRRPEITSPTLVMPYPEPRDGVPRLRTDIDLRDLQLTVYEAFVLSRIDGSSTVEALRTELGLSKLEISVVLGTLKDKGIVHVHEPQPAPRSRPPAAASAIEPVPAASPPPRPSIPPPRPSTLPPRPSIPAPRTATPLPRTTASSSAAGLRPVPPPSRGAASPTRKTVMLGVPGTERLAGSAQAGDDLGASAPRPATSEVESPLQKAIRLENSGDLAGAIQFLEQAIARSRAPGCLYNRLAIALVKERRDYFRAEELINKAIKLEPSNSTYRSNLAKVLMMIASYSGLVPIPEDAKKW